MYIFQAIGSKIIREEIDMKKFGDTYHPVNDSIKLSLIFLANEPKEEDLDKLVPFGNDKYIMFSEDGDVLKYIDKLTECRKQELKYKEIEIANLKNKINEKDFEVIIVED